MCLAVPGQLIEVKGDEALASLHGSRLRISTALVPGAKAGDWVLIHAGFAIQKLEGTDLEETWAILEDLAASGQSAVGSGQEAKQPSNETTIGQTPEAAR